MIKGQYFFVRTGLRLDLLLNYVTVPKQLFAGIPQNSKDFKKILKNKRDGIHFKSL